MHARSQAKPATESAPAKPKAAGESTQAKAASEGVYTKAQAERGLTFYDTSCASCHELSKFKGTEFSNAWTGKPLTELHTAVLSMPMDAPGSMKPQEYSDILAYFLSINGYPAGADRTGRRRRGDQGRQARREEALVRSQRSAAPMPPRPEHAGARR